MRRIISRMKIDKIATILITTLLGFSTFGQATGSDEKNIEMTVASLYAAMVERDEVTLENLTSESLTYGHSSGTIENRSEYIDAVVNGSFDFISIIPTDQTISISENSAIVRHIFVSKAIDDGSPVAVKIGCLMVFQKQKNKWKLLARQAYKL